jgi:hypothetical protein
MKTLIMLALLCACPAFSQMDVSVDEGPPKVGYTVYLPDYDVNGNPLYQCTARSLQPSTTFRRSDSTITSITDSSNTATIVLPNHGLLPNNGITISGATVDTDLNGTYSVVSVSDANTFTITTASVTDAAYSESTLTITTTAPRTNQPIWAILRLTYSSANLVTKQWAGGTSSANARICANRASLSYQ